MNIKKLIFILSVTTVFIESKINTPEKTDIQQYLTNNESELISVLQALNADNSEEAVKLKSILNEIANGNKDESLIEYALRECKMDKKSLAFHSVGIGLTSVGIFAFCKFLEETFECFYCDNNFEIGITPLGYGVYASIIYFISCAWFKFKNYFDKSENLRVFRKQNSAETKTKTDHLEQLTALLARRRSLLVTSNNESNTPSLYPPVRTSEQMLGTEFLSSAPPFTPTTTENLLEV